MQLNDYVKASARTDIHNQPYREQITQGAVELTLEAAEVLDLVKRLLWRGEPINLDEMREELGDVFWCIGKLCRTMNLDAEDILARNFAKLLQRHPDGMPGPR